MYFLDVAATLLNFEAHALGRPFHAASVSFGPRAAASPHGHADFFEFMAVVSGTGGHRLADGGARPLSAGDLVLVRPRDEHLIYGSPPAGMTFVNVAFAADAWRSFVDLTGVDGREREASPPCTSVPLAALTSVFDGALDAFGRRPTMLDLVRFWSGAIELMADAPEPYETAGRPEWLTRACLAMRRESNLRGGVPRLLELASVSPAHLSRSMRLHNGVTPTQFVASLRLEHAATLLAAGSATVTEIAYRCGFSSQSYFTRCFRDAHGLSPRTFRQQARRAFVP